MIVLNHKTLSLKTPYQTGLGIKLVAFSSCNIFVPITSVFLFIYHFDNSFIQLYKIIILLDNISNLLNLVCKFSECELNMFCFSRFLFIPLIICIVSDLLPYIVIPQCLCICSFFVDFFS
jgi:hypothetical protein